MKILIVDDEPDQRELLKGFLENQGYDVLCAADGREAISLFRKEPIQVVLLDQRMPDMNGEEVLEKIKEINPLVRAMMITAYGAVNTAVNVMKLGADDFLEKPVDLSVLLEKIQTLEQKISVEEDVNEVEDSVSLSSLPINIVAESPEMKEVLSMARRVADTPWSVLIRGETGTGKELMARLIHLLSPRSDGPYVEVNCAAIPENLFESELFGHEKGAFTGAVSRRRGKFEMAREGTLFLDEIGELPPALQPKLLRALQEKKICRVGSEKDLETDVRVIAATNRDLKKLAEKGSFREDLYYRLNVFEIDIPPLRNRKQDIPALVKFFMERYSTRPMELSPEAMDILIKYPLPGNVRELEHIVQRAVTLSRGRVIKPMDLPPEIRHYQAISTGTLNERLEAVERETILSALEKAGGVQTAAARMLGISERVLRYKMAKHGIRRIR